jgi:hypothetical protein
MAAMDVHSAPVKDRLAFMLTGTAALCRFALKPTSARNTAQAFPHSDTV